MYDTHCICFLTCGTTFGPQQATGTVAIDLGGRVWEWGKVHEVTRRVPTTVWEECKETVEESKMEEEEESGKVMPRRRRPIRSRASFVSCGRKHVGIVDMDGRVYTWGCGFFGRLGVGDELSRAEPTWVETLRCRDPGGGAADRGGQLDTLAALVRFH